MMTELGAHLADGVALAEDEAVRPREMDSPTRATTDAEHAGVSR